MASETKGTVAVALAANLGVGVAKGIGGLVTGSSALMAEAAHSVADTLNEIFLMLSLKRADRKADATHPFGYGKERFFWSLLAAVGIFVSGAVFSVAEGVHALTSAESKETTTREFVVIYAILGLSLVLEGASLAKALGQVRREAAAARRRVLAFIVHSPDPTVKTVASEDTIAVLGVFVALAGTVLHQVTGSVVWDATASIVIGALLGYVAFVLGRDTKELLIGEAADPAVRLKAFLVLSEHDEVVAVKEMLTMQLGPENVLLAARVQFDERMSAGDLERLCTRIEQEMHTQVPSLTQVFLDPSVATSEDLERVSSRLHDTLAKVGELDGDSDALSAAGRLPRSRLGRGLRSGSTRAVPSRTG